MTQNFLTCVARAVVTRALDALSNHRPFDGVLATVAQESLAAWKGMQPDSGERRQELETLCSASPYEVRAQALKISEELAPPPDAAVALLAYLEAIPDRVRQALDTSAWVSSVVSPAMRDPSLELLPYLPARSPLFKRGTRVRGGYELARLLGIGGFGEVWLVEDKALKFFVGADAVKKLTHEKALLDRIAGLGGHPGLVPLRGAWLDADPPFLVYDYVKGGDLSRLIRNWASEKPTDHVDRTLRILFDLAHVLAFLHGQEIPIVHRDLKPANILLERVGTEDEVRVTDLGIGGLFTADVRGHTRTINSLGGKLLPELQGAMTENYASQEQITGMAPHPRDDIYAVGVIAYQMLTANLLRKPQHDWKRNLTRNGVPENVIVVLEGCIEEAANRFNDGRILVNQLMTIPGLREWHERREAERQRRAEEIRQREETRKREEARLQEEARQREVTRQRESLAAAIRSRPTRLSMLGIDFVWIPPGTFLMGSPDLEEARQGDENQHSVTLTQGFYLGVYPVTQAQWRAVMGINHSAFYRRGLLMEQVSGMRDSDVDQLPVDSVSWNMAHDFCTKLSRTLGKRFTLPTEAQWEYACRAGTSTPFYFGAVLDGNQANCNGSYPYGTVSQGPYPGRPTPVGSYLANAWGLYDMHGNVWEWCEDTYSDSLGGESVIDPLWSPCASPKKVDTKLRVGGVDRPLEGLRGYIPQR